MSVKSFIDNLGLDHRRHWKKLIGHIRDSKCGYDHSSFLDDEENTTPCCALSHAILHDMLGDVTIEHYYSFKQHNVYKVEEMFGDEAFEKVFNEDSDFHNYLKVYCLNYDNPDAAFDKNIVADALSKFLGFDDLSKKIKHVTVHWKNHRQDHFENMEALESYFNLNPQRANTYRKITQTYLSPRTVYDEVTEEVEL